MQVYLPADLYREVKRRRLSASELLQRAVRAEARKRALEAEADRYVRELVAEVGAPTEADRAWAEVLADRIEAHAARTSSKGHRPRKAG